MQLNIQYDVNKFVCQSNKNISKSILAPCLNVNGHRFPPEYAQASDGSFTENYFVSGNTGFSMSHVLVVYTKEHRIDESFLNNQVPAFIRCLGYWHQGIVWSFHNQDHQGPRYYTTWFSVACSWSVRRYTQYTTTNYVWTYIYIYSLHPLFNNCAHIYSICVLWMRLIRLVLKVGYKKNMPQPIRLIFTSLSWHASNLCLMLLMA